MGRFGIKRSGLQTFDIFWVSEFNEHRGNLDFGAKGCKVGVRTSGLLARGSGLRLRVAIAMSEGSRETVAVGYLLLRRVAGDFGIRMLHLGQKTPWNCSSFPTRHVAERDRERERERKTNRETEKKRDLPTCKPQPTCILEALLTMLVWDRPRFPGSILQAF